MKVLFISNGHGEDAIGAHLATTMQQLKKVEIVAMPLVGRGLAYEKAGFEVLGPRQEMPSGGFMFTSLNAFWKDLQAGFIKMSQKQYRTIKNSQSDAVVIVGDIYALWIAIRYAKNRPIFQVQPLVSLYYQQGMDLKERLQRLSRTTVDSFVWLERYLMKKINGVYVRDELSADWLRKNGVPKAKHLGNVMMDLIEKPEINIDILFDGRPIIALLPGTRDDYLFSLPIMLQIAELAMEFQFIISSKVDLNKIKLPLNWCWQEPDEKEKMVSAAKIALHSSGLRVPVLENAFSGLLHQCEMAIGTAGTANEQVVGLGKPVIGFFTDGPQYLPSFAKAQKRLLGQCLFLEEAKPQLIAKKIRQIYSDIDLKGQIEELGRMRMGTAGGSGRIAKEILEEIDR